MVLRGKSDYLTKPTFINLKARRQKEYRWKAHRKVNQLIQPRRLLSVEKRSNYVFEKKLAQRTRKKTILCFLARPACCFCPSFYGRYHRHFVGNLNWFLTPLIMVFNKSLSHEIFSALWDLFKYAIKKEIQKPSWIFLSHWIIFAENVDMTIKNGQVIRSIFHYFLVILDQYVASYSL